jgi:hypothetical protein
MPLTAKVVVPYPAWGLAHHSLMDRVEKCPITLFAAPPGYVLTDSLAERMFDKGWPAAWCRLAQEDGDPGVLLLSLIQALQQLSAATGSETLERMRQQPGPVYGWPQLYALLAQEASSSLPLPCWLVFENVSHLENNGPSLNLLVQHFLSLMPVGVHTILVASCKHTSNIPTLGVNDLRLDLITGGEIVRTGMPGLPNNQTVRLMQLINGQAGALAGVMTAALKLGQERIEQLLKQSNSTEDLLTRIARAYLLAENSATIEALVVCTQIEFCHARLVQSVLQGVSPPDGPWWQPLEDGWRYLRQEWRQPLHVALRSPAPGHAALARTANFYLQQKAPEKAIPLYFLIGELSKAAEVMDREADRMMDLGQWELLRTWINQLPSPVLQQWPWLVYAASEMIASQGDVNASRKAFGKTISLFKDHEDAPGVCQSLLAECALAILDSDYGGAVGAASEALLWAEKASIFWYIVWANWALGCLQLQSDQIDQSQSFFQNANQAAEHLAIPEVTQLMDSMVTLIETRQSIAREREQHRLEYLKLESMELSIGNQIHYLIQDTPDYVGGLLKTCGWSNVPLTLKLPYEPSVGHPQAVNSSATGWSFRLVEGVFVSPDQIRKLDKKARRSI